MYVLFHKLRTHPHVAGFLLLEFLADNFKQRIRVIVEEAGGVSTTARTNSVSEELRTHQRFAGFLFFGVLGGQIQTDNPCYCWKKPVGRDQRSQ